MTMCYAGLVAAGLFPRAMHYHHSADAGPAVRERAARPRIFPYSERHLQCVWYDPALRPARLLTSQGEEAVVDDPGVWNLEAGPDFLGAVLRVGPDQRRLHGDVEVHVFAADWQHHAHRQDARYERVRFHVTYFPGVLPAGALPGGALQISLQQALAATPSFSFENVDLAAFPFGVRAAEPPCRLELRHWPPEAKEFLLDAAGEERLRRKAERLAIAAQERGADQALFEECCAALGYKHNKTAFRALARAVGHDRLRDRAAGDTLAAFAILAGTAGLMPVDVCPAWDEETRVFVRRVWHHWWRLRESFAPRMMAPGEWQTGGRPTNHPLRRMMAAAQLFCAPRPLAESLREAGLGGRPEAWYAALTPAADAYWNRRATLGGAVQDAPASLLGRERAEALLVNVVVPFLAAQDVAAPFRAGLLSRLPAEGGNALLRQTAFNLFGPDHPGRLYATGLRRQGLLQVFHDFCLNDRSRCAHCPFPAMLRRHREPVPA